jgi:pilus assembly protein Flp/PilA
LQSATASDGSDPFSPSAFSLFRSSTVRQFAKLAIKFLKTEDGPTAVEYAVMLALIIVVCIASITALGQGANGTFTNVALNGTLSGS